MSTPSRSFAQWILSPPFPSFEYFSESASAYLIWKGINVYVDLQERGLDLFTGPRAERLGIWREFRNFVRQAEAYYWAGSQVKDSSASLLYYYSMLNLARPNCSPTLRPGRKYCTKRYITASPIGRPKRRP
jgi:hypothetical protein